MTETSLDKLFAGDRRTLARYITLVESKRETDREVATRILAQVMARAGGSLRIGISGAPGVGKSSFIDALGQQLVQAGHKLAVLAVDPSSPLAGGSILGDKTRMEALARESGAYIRPSPSTGSLGGVAGRTRESIVLCEAAGFDIVIVETIGVGQSEVDVAGMVDIFVVLVLPNAGDELQGIKRGIVELADLIVVNKADGNYQAAAGETVAQYSAALRLLQSPWSWQPRVLSCSAKEKCNIDAVWEVISEFQAQASSTGDFEQRRSRQNRDWLHRLLQDLLDRRFRENPAVQERLPLLEAQVARGEITPHAALDALANLI